MPPREYRCAGCGGTFTYEAGRGKKRLRCETCSPARPKGYRKHSDEERARLNLYGPGASPFQVVTDGKKLCSKCGALKSLEDFEKAKRASGRAAECRDCRRTIPSREPEVRRRVTRDEYRRNGIARLRLKLYGLSPAQYAEMMEAQNGVCAICGEPERHVSRLGHPKPLAVDHCHETNAIRGLLCGNCNTAIAMLRHDVNLLNRARDYLQGG